MTIRGINFGSIVVAGFVGAYLMFFVDHWFAGMWGLFGLFPGTSNPWWLLEHHIDGIIFALLFAWPPIYHMLPGPGWFKGTLFFFVWGVAYLIVQLVAGAWGAHSFKMIPFTWPIVISALLLHPIYGFFVGAIYNAPSKEAATA